MHSQTRQIRHGVIGSTGPLQEGALSQVTCTMHSQTDQAPCQLSGTKSVRSLLHRQTHCPRSPAQCMTRQGHTMHASSHPYQAYNVQDSRSVWIRQGPVPRRLVPGHLHNASKPGQIMQMHVEIGYNATSVASDHACKSSSWCMIRMWTMPSSRQRRLQGTRTGHVQIPYRPHVHALLHACTCQIQFDSSCCCVNSPRAWPAAAVVQLHA